MIRPEQSSIAGIDFQSFMVVSFLRRGNCESVVDQRERVYHGCFLPVKRDPKSPKEKRRRCSASSVPGIHTESYQTTPDRKSAATWFARRQTGYLCSQGGGRPGLRGVGGVRVANCGIVVRGRHTRTGLLRRPVSTLGLPGTIAQGFLVLQEKSLTDRARARPPPATTPGGEGALAISTEVRIRGRPPN